jgi:mRNA interferase RelE/StbE
VNVAPWRVELARTAQRDLRRLDPPVRIRVQESLHALAEDPHRAGHLRKLTGAPEWRLRIGDWRALVLVDEQQRVIQVTASCPAAAPTATEKAIPNLCRCAVPAHRSRASTGAAVRGGGTRTSPGSPPSPKPAASS